ncbi:hypothetical protein ACGFI3_44830 [Nonomuraea wenchangensis]|uniref:hypothetical protein n=1 Tax=Nonomuraea wenchangensis TaxID=568860 RepID=UPI00370FE81F
MIVQLAFGLAAFSDPRLFALPLRLVGVVVLMGWLVARWSSRRKWVRWCVVDREFGWVTLVHPATLLPLAIVVGLLTPAAARWFDR